MIAIEKNLNPRRKFLFYGEYKCQDSCACKNAPLTVLSFLYTCLFESPSHILIDASGRTKNHLGEARSSVPNINPSRTWRRIAAGNPSRARGVDCTMSD